MGGGAVSESAMIVCLGWGSLIWCPDSLPTIGDWHADGPDLPVEFARQSKDGRITLVIEPGAKRVPVSWTRLTVGSIDAARRALADREGVCLSKHAQSIGHWSLKDASQHRESAGIGEWARAKGVDAAVWTALQPRFNGERVTPTREEVVARLRSLEGPERTKAEEYVRKAPPQIRTAYRKTIELELGWTALPDEGPRQLEAAPG